MTLRLAEECIRRAKLKASALRITVSIAVVDDAGSLVAYARMRERPIAIGERKTIAKARTAVNYKKDTMTLMKEFTGADYPGNYFIIGMSAMYPDEFWGGPGGVPIIVHGEVIGAVGVAGSTGENDHECATAGAGKR